MKCTVISDTHCKHRELKLRGGDILFHCGDYSFLGQIDETLEFMSWLSSQPYTYKVFIAGNHDWGFEPLTEGLEEDHTFYFRGKYLIFRGLNEQYKDRAEKLGLIYLHNESVIIEGFKIYGTPYQAMIDKHNIWAFNYYDDDLYSWDHVPENTDVLLTHSPPYGILDSSAHRFGSKGLAKRVSEVKPLVHCFGHIHEGYGRLKKDGTVYINAATLDKEYRTTNEPKNFTLKR